MNPKRRAPITPGADWVKAQPQKMPKPTYWPFFMAMGTAFLLWGLVAGWVIGLIGVLIMVVALGGWIANLRHESGNDRR